MSRLEQRVKRLEEIEAFEEELAACPNHRHGYGYGPGPEMVIFLTRGKP